MGANPFGLLLAILRSTDGQNMSSKSMGHFGYFPRQTGVERPLSLQSTDYLASQREEVHHSSFDFRQLCR